MIDEVFSMNLSLEIFETKKFWRRNKSTLRIKKTGTRACRSQSHV